MVIIKLRVIRRHHIAGVASRGTHQGFGNPLLIRARPRASCISLADPGTFMTQIANMKSARRRGGISTSGLPEVSKEFVANGAGVRGAPADTGQQTGRKRLSADSPHQQEANARRLHADTSMYSALHSPMPGRGSGRGSGRGGGRGRGQNRGMSNAPASSQAVEQQKPRKRHDAPPASNGVSSLRFDDIEGLSAPSKRAMKEGFEYEYATTVQIATMQTALAGRDLLARARTGTGKTLGFVLPTIERIKLSVEARTGPRTAVYTVIVSPTRELATQIANEAKMVCKFHSTELAVQLIVGGSNRNAEATRLSRGPNSILVCTPGRFHDHVENTAGFRAMLKHTKVAILDECDRLLEMGFRNEMVKLLGTLPPTDLRQTLLFSATMPSNLKSITSLALRQDHDYIDCVGEGATETATLAHQTAAIAPKDEWLPRLGQVRLGCSCTSVSQRMPCVSFMHAVWHQHPCCTCFGLCARELGHTATCRSSARARWCLTTR
jgi:hypothetical protein